MFPIEACLISARFDSRDLGRSAEAGPEEGRPLAIRFLGQPGRDAGIRIFSDFPAIPFGSVGRGKGVAQG